MGLKQEFVGDGAAASSEFVLGPDARRKGESGVKHFTESVSSLRVTVGLAFLLVDQGAENGRLLFLGLSSPASSLMPKVSGNVDLRPAFPPNGLLTLGIRDEKEERRDELSDSAIESSYVSPCSET